MKRCTRCGVHRPFDAFPRDASKRDGHAARCRECRSAVRRERRRELAAERRERDRAHAEANPSYKRVLRRYRPVARELMTPPPDPEAAERARRIVALADAALTRLGA